MFVRSSCTLDQNLGLVCDYAAAYPETHYNNNKCAVCVRSALCAASALCAEPEHSTVGGSKKINIESIAIAIGHRNYRNATAMLSKRPALIPTQNSVSEWRRPVRRGRQVRRWYVRIWNLPVLGTGCIFDFCKADEATCFWCGC